MFLASGPLLFDDFTKHIQFNFSLDIAEQLDSHQALVKQLAKAWLNLGKNFTWADSLFISFRFVPADIGVCSEV